MTDDFTVFSDKDKQGFSYGVCVGGAALTGAAVGRILGLQGLAVGAAAGLAYGLMACPHLKEPIKRKLFSQNGKLSDAELSHALQTVKRETGVKSKADAMFLLSAARAASASESSSSSSNSSQTRQSLPLIARQLLQRKA